MANLTNPLKDLVARALAKRASDKADAAKAAADAVSGKWISGTFSDSTEMFYKYNLKLGILSIYGRLNKSITSGAVSVGILPEEARPVSAVSFHNVGYGVKSDTEEHSVSVSIAPDGNVTAGLNSTRVSVSDAFITATICMAGNGGNWPTLAQ